MFYQIYLRHKQITISSYTLTNVQIWPAKSCINQFQTLTLFISNTLNKNILFFILFFFLISIIKPRSTFCRFILYKILVLKIYTIMYTKETEIKKKPHFIWLRWAKTIMVIVVYYENLKHYPRWNTSQRIFRDIPNPTTIARKSSKSSAARARIRPKFYKIYGNISSVVSRLFSCY